jgi:hypothetical protein
MSMYGSHPIVRCHGCKIRFPSRHGSEVYCRKCSRERQEAAKAKILGELLAKHHGCTCPASDLISSGHLPGCPERKSD